MTRTLLTLMVLASLAPIARADEGESQAVEIVRPTRTREAAAPKEIVLEEPASSEAQSATTERTAKQDDAEARARAAQQKKLEELARQTQEEFRKAANALAGE